MPAHDRLHTPREIIEYLDQFVAGQERAKRDLAITVYRHYLGLAARNLPGCAGFGPQHALVIGPTGAGKTLLVRTLAAWLGVPVAFSAATALVEAGYVGEQVESCLASLLVAAGGDTAKAERGIVYLDEFDKVRRSESLTRDVSGEGVQNALLSLFDGTRSRFHVHHSDFKLDTSRILFLCSGAFSGLDDVVRRRCTQRAGMGFGARVRDSHLLTREQALERVTAEDLIEYGFIPELVNRFATLTAVRALGTAEMLHILAKVQGSVLQRLRHECELHGVRLDVPEPAQRVFAERAIGSGGGARALSRLVNEVFAPVAWRLPELSVEGVGCVRITAAAAAGEAPPELLARSANEAAPDVFPTANELRFAALGAPPGSRPSRAARSTHETLKAIEEYKAELGFQQLAMPALVTWRGLEKRHEPRAILEALVQLHVRHIPLAKFIEALELESRPDLKTVLSCAAYLHQRAEYDASLPSSRTRRGRSPAADDDSPRLDL